MKILIFFKEFLSEDAKLIFIVKSWKLGIDLLVLFNVGDFSWIYGKWMSFECGIFIAKFKVGMRVVWRNCVILKKDFWIEKIWAKKLRK
jgi:hypothetical protein